MATPRGAGVIGRILAIGMPLPGPRVDNYSIINAPSFYDYEALVIEPDSQWRVVQSILDGASDAKTFTGDPVLAARNAAGDVSLDDVLAQRTEETRMLLDRGGLVVCFAQPVRELELPGGASHSYGWLGGRPGLRAADGTQVHVVDAHHEFAPFVIEQAAQVSYRARAANGARKVFAQSVGGAAVAFELEDSSGRIVMLPALRAVPSGDARYAMSDVLQSCVRHALGAMAEGRPPWWVDAQALPGLPERAEGVERARGSLDEAQQAFEAASAAHDEIARYRRLLWQAGVSGLHDVVIDALRLVGYQVYAGDPARIELRDGDDMIIVEIAADDGEVGMAVHYRLRERIEQAIAQRGAAPGAIAMINGHRLQPPDKRPAQASQPLLTAAETMRYGIATTCGLFAAVQAALAGDTGASAAYRARLRERIGLCEGG